MAELNAEEVAAVAEALPKFIEGMTKLRLSMITLSTAFISGAASFAYADKRLRKQYEQQAEEEIQQMREHFHAKVVSMEKKPGLDGMVRDLGYVPAVENKKEPEYDTPVEGPNTQVVDESETANVFDPEKRAAFIEDLKGTVEPMDPADGWDYEAELANRGTTAPYVINIDEQGEQQGFTESTWTYYEGDDVICDARDKVVDDWRAVIGEDFQNKFGHGSGDPNVVYIRNPVLLVEIELCRSPNSYAEEVHGLKHSDETVRYPRRKSFDDE